MTVARRRASSRFRCPRRRDPRRRQRREPRRKAARRRGRQARSSRHSLATRASLNVRAARSGRRAPPPPRAASRRPGRSARASGRARRRRAPAGQVVQLGASAPRASADAAYRALVGRYPVPRRQLRRWSLPYGGTKPRWTQRALAARCARGTASSPSSRPRGPLCRNLQMPAATIAIVDRAGG